MFVHSILEVVLTLFPAKLNFSGTVRSFNNDVRNILPKKLERIIADITHSYRADYDFKFHYGTPATINDKYSSEIAIKVVETLYGEESLITYPAVMGGEDFAKMLAKNLDVLL